MGARFTVYCLRSVAKVTPQDLLAGVSGIDLETIAEGDNVPDDLIESALSQLRVENQEPGGFSWYRLCYRPAGMRQVDIQRCQNADEVRGVVEEVLEELAVKHHPALKQIRQHLEETIDIIDASFGFSPGEQIAPTLASEASRWLAEHFDGIVRAANDSWWKLGPQCHEYQPLEP